MSKRDQIRFYEIAELYDDDERLMAFAIVELLKHEAEPLDIYKELLNCRYGRWIDYLEQIADEVRFDVLKEWCSQKQFELDFSCDLIWACSDFKMLEFRGWKLNTTTSLEE